MIWMQVSIDYFINSGKMMFNQSIANELKR